MVIRIADYIDRWTPVFEASTEASDLGVYHDAMGKGIDIVQSSDDSSLTTHLSEEDARRLYLELGKKYANVR